MGVLKRVLYRTVTFASLILILLPLFFYYILYISATFNFLPYWQIVDDYFPLIRTFLRKENPLAMIARAKGAKRFTRGEGSTSKTKEAARQGCVRPFLVIFAVYCSAKPVFWSGRSPATGFFKGCSQLEPVLFPYRTSLSTGAVLRLFASPILCSISEQHQKKDKRKRKKERAEGEGIPVLSTFDHLRTSTD